ncbi:response regulator [Paenibacillus sp.]|uniref:response regulator n=1 Tax=Paenibacillus sp. TaxID=58172 RepID=UPI002810EE80|nr:response regulator [Paenibacillus sp.]
MTTYKLLIVEDERWEREGLLDFLDWASLGIEIVGAARDGIDGWERALELEPDLIITDIRMPGMDGLEMAKKIKDAMPETVIVVLTGFSDFEYARRALQTQVNQYVLKPIEEEELQRAVSEAVEECARVRRRRRDEAELKAAALEHRALAIAKLAADAMEGRLPKERAPELRKAAGFASASGAFAAILFAGVPGLAEDDVRRAVGAPCLALPDAGGAVEHAWTVVLAADDAGARAVANGLAARLAKPGGFARPEDAVVAVGGAADGLTEAWKSVRAARSALEYAVFWGLSGVALPEAVEREKAAFYAEANEFLAKVGAYAKQVVYGVSALDEKKAVDAASGMFDAISSQRGAEREYVRNYLTGLYFELSMLAGDPEANEGEAAARFDRLSTLRQFRAHGLAVAKSMIAFLANKREGKDDYIVSKVNRLIETSYMSTDLSLTAAAAEVFLSPNYLGALYKKATGRTFHERLTECRMDKAKELLGRSEYKVSRVAKEVGIPNTSYFCTVFKNAVGMTPGEYQELAHR